MEKWKDDIMNSLEGMGKAQPPAGTFSKIQSRIASQKDQQQPAKQWIAVAAIISLVAIFNIYFIISQMQPEPETNQQFQTGIFSNYNLYE